METVEVLSKALRVLECFTKESPELSLGEITRILDMPKTTVFRITSTLLINDYLETNEVTKKYRLGKMVAALSANYLNQIDMRNIALPLMTSMRNATGETTYLSTLRNNQRVITDYLLGTKDIVYVPEIGRLNRLYSGASSKVILAFHSDEKIEEILFNEESIIQSIFKTTPSKLKQEIIKIRQQQYAFSISEHSSGIAAISAPIIDYQGITGSITIGFPESRLSSTNLDEIVALVKDGSAQITARLGGKLNG